MDSLAKAVRIVREAKKQKRLRPLGVTLLAERYANKLDLWTGKPLEVFHASQQIVSRRDSQAT
jgi:hypothetical protein